jgi:adenosylmethionine-8-amino-7-oxononanoate aminotransferase
MGDFNAVAGPDEYYTRVAEICRRHGLLLIADEVTTGFGRTGKLFASQDWNPQPDMLCLGKAITNGYFPLSACLATEAIYERFHGKENMFAHGVTHGGHPVACAVGLAAMDLILREKLAENSALVGEYLKCELEKLMDHRQLIGEVRGQGLMIALELVKDRATKEPLGAKETHAIGIDLVALGLVLSDHGNHLRLYPPLITDKALADKMVAILDRALDRGFMSQIGIKVRLLAEFAAAKFNP